MHICSNYHPALVSKLLNTDLCSSHQYKKVGNGLNSKFPSLLVDSESVRIVSTKQQNKINNFT